MVWWGVGAEDVHWQGVSDFAKSFILPCRNAPPTSAIATSLSSNALIISGIIKASKDTVGEEVSVLVYNFFSCGLLPSVQVLPLIFPQRLSLISVIALRASLFCSLVSVLASIAPNTLRSCSWVNSAKIALMAFCP